MRYLTLGVIVALTVPFVRAVEPLAQRPSPVQVSEADEIPVDVLEAQARNDSDRWFLLQRTYPSRTVSARGFDRALREVEALKREARTLDGGRSWWMLTPDLEYPNINSIAVDPRDPKIVYVGTRGGPQNGVLLRSMDGGATWERLEGPVESGFRSYRQRVIIDSSRAGLAQTSRLYAEGVGGLFRSDDSGRSFRKVLGVQSDDRRSVNLEDFAIDRTRPESVLALVWELTCASGSWLWDCRTRRREIVLYRSFDGGNRWTRHGIHNSLSNLYSGRIAICPAGANSLIAAFLDSTDQRIWVFRSADSGESWSEIPRPTGSYLAWPLVVAFAPDPADTVYIGNLNLHKSTNWGQTWTDLRVPHVDQTVVTFDATTRLISGNEF